MTVPSFLPLTGIYEPSAIQQLPDGRFLVVEDEKQFPLSLFSLRGDGDIESRPVARDADDPLGKLDDLEGLTLDNAGNIYAITSHSRTGEGEDKKSRNKLLRFRLDGDRLVAGMAITTLKPALTAALSALADAAAILDVKREGGLNIEAIEMVPDTQQLLIGFRSPLIDGQALLACLENPADVFERDAVPRIAPSVIRLDLAGHGFRGLAWLAALGGYLIVSGPVAREQVQFRLWFWSGHANDPARRVSVPGLEGYEHAEGISSARLDGQQKIILVSDDGDRAEGRCARYLLLEPGQLRIE